MWLTIALNFVLKVLCSERIIAIALNALLKLIRSNAEDAAKLERAQLTGQRAMECVCAFNAALDDGEFSTEEVAAVREAAEAALDAWAEGDPTPDAWKQQRP